MAEVFAKVEPGTLLSLLLAGLIVGYVVEARLAAHVNVWLLALRWALLGLVFLGSVMFNRALSGAPTWPTWIGVGVAYLVYLCGVLLGVRLYDHLFARTVERTLGHPLRRRQR